MKNIILKSGNKIKVQEGDTCQIIDIVDTNFLSKQKNKTLIDISSNTNVEYIFLLTNDFDKDSIDNRKIKVAHDSSVKFIYFYFCKNNIDVVLNLDIGKNSTVENNVLIFGKGNQNIKFVETHKFKKSESDGKFFTQSILLDKSNLDSSSLIKIDKNLNKVSARLDINSIIFGDKASSKMIPSLEINSNDVKASHGAVISNIDDENLFYLQSRGLTKDEIRKMYIFSILENFINKISTSDIKSKIQNIAHKLYL